MAQKKKQRGAAARTLGQVGLGIMGSAFANHLRAAGFDIIGFDPDAKRQAALKRLGGRVARSAAAVASECEVLITSLPSLAAVESAFFGQGGIAEGAAAGTIVIEAS